MAVLREEDCTSKGREGAIILLAEEWLEMPEVLTGFMKALLSIDKASLIKGPGGKGGGGSRSVPKAAPYLWLSNNIRVL